LPGCRSPQLAAFGAKIGPLDRFSRIRGLFSPWPASEPAIQGNKHGICCPGFVKFTLRPRFARIGGPPMESVCEKDAYAR